MSVKVDVDQADVRLDALPPDVWPAFEAFAEGLPGVPPPDKFGIPGYLRQPAPRDPG